MSVETELTEALLRTEIYHFCGTEHIPLIDLTPEMESTMMRLYQRAFITGVNRGIEVATEKIIEGISDGVEFVAEQYKIK